MNRLGVGGCLFGMVIWANFLLLEREFLVVEVVVVEGVDVVQAGFFVSSKHGCLGDMRDAKVVIEVVVDVVVLVWWGDLWCENGCGSLLCRKYRRGFGE